MPQTPKMRARQQFSYKTVAICSNWPLAGNGSVYSRETQVGSTLFTVDTPPSHSKFGAEGCGPFLPTSRIGVLASADYGEIMTNEILLIDTAERVLTLTLNRPQSRNALSAALRDQFFAALAAAETDDDVDVIILTGADPVFCAGLDLKELGGQSALPDISPRWPALTKPVIGAINGAAVTGGLELALYCDILIASEQARFADTHARVGLLPTWGLSVRLPQKVGVGLARRMSLTGDYLSATDALRAGLVTEVVEHQQLLPAARQVAASIVGNNQNAVRALLASYHRIDDSSTAQGLWLEATAAREFRTSGDDIAANREAVLNRGRSQVR